MVSHTFTSGLIGKLLPAVTVLAGIGIAAGLATAPAETLNAVVERSGLPAILPAAAPPIGVTGRSVLALVAGGLFAMLGFVGILKRAVFAAGPSAEPLPAIRRADAHPDAPPRRPIRASEDLGVPLPMLDDDEPFVRPALRPVSRMDTEMAEPRIAKASAPVAEPSSPLPPLERALPRDLDLPLSFYDPGAVPAAPMPPVRPVAPLVKRPAPPEEPAERIETFELTPMTRPALVPASDESISSLLDRLERGAQRRAAMALVPPALVPSPTPVADVFVSLDETLHRLRRLATG
jgi:hypothetical protein